ALGVTERRRSFAILAALGATRRQLAAFLWSEGLIVFIGGAALGVLVGVGIAQMLVKLLTGVFDPPPDSLAVPTLYIAALIAIAGFALVPTVVLNLPMSEARLAREIRRI